MSTEIEQGGAPVQTPTSGVPQELRYSDPGDIDEFIATVERYERGELSSDQFRAYRLVRGVYGQRQDDVQMVRIKIPQGALHPEQLEALADVAERSPRQIGHVTTRQNVQLHFVKLHDCADLMRILDRAGLTTRAACGNSVRNVTADPRAGLSPHEVFDATPFGDAVVRYLLRHPLSETLPRKFKIAISGDPNDPCMGAINDIGFIAHRAADGSRRFKIRAAGGLSTVPTEAFVLHESYPAERILEVAEALLRVFDRTGDRKNRHKARLKFVVRKLGREAFVKLYEETLAEVLSSARPPAITVPDLDREPVVDWALPPLADPELRAFARTNVSKTRHVGRVFVTIRLPVGDLTHHQFRALAGIARTIGEGQVRLTIDQNLLLRDVRVEDLPRLHEALKAIGLATPGAGTSADVTSCPGADSCKLAITHSRDMAKVLTERLDARPVDGVAIKISGCPNSCGMHHVGTIGFHGAVRKIGSKAAPFYNVLAGAKVDASGARFARTIGKVPAKRVEETIDRLLRHAESIRGEGEPIADVLARVPLEELKNLLRDLTELTEAEALASDFVDFGSETAFEVVTMEGECAA